MENWRPIPGWEGYYEASDQGRIRSVDRRVWHTGGRSPRWVTYKGKILRGRPHRSGHLTVWLCREGRPRANHVHRLILETFAGPCPEGQECRHLNGDPTDNRLDNLVWGTHRENMADKFQHGTDHYSTRTHCKNGHEFTPENTRYPQGGGRQCRACERQRQQRRKERRSERTEV